MPNRRRSALPVALLCVSMALAGCKTDEERAEDYYQSAQQLMAEGDDARAMIELRNVFKKDGHHREARITYARLLVKQGQEAEAYAQYLRLVEQYPDSIEGLTALASIAIERDDWESAERYGRSAATQAPDMPETQALAAALDYRAGLDGNDTAATARAAAAAGEVLERLPESRIARRVVLDAQARKGDWAGALATAEAGLAQDDTELRLHQAKLQALAELGDDAAIGAHLRHMVQVFPGDDRITSNMIGWYMHSGDPGGAETFLRELAADAPPDRRQALEMSLVQFLHQTRGANAAKAELDRLVAENGADSGLYRSLRAGLAFEAGETEAAIAEMQDILGDAEPSARTHDTRIGLARMLRASGNPVGARAQVEQVLAEDPAHVAALQMRAQWLIEADQPGDAISVLRSALDQDPRNPDTLTLMAEAHLRDGSRELAGERLAMAVEVSDQSAEESLRYVSFLTENDQLDAARTVLTDALRRAPGNQRLLSVMGDIYLRESDWPRATQVIGQLQELAAAPGTPPADAIAAREAANGLRVSLLFRQQGAGESMAFLEGLIAEGQAAPGAAAMVVRAHLQNGEIERAANYLDGLLAEHPDDRDLRFLRAGLHAASGQPAEAEAAYRALIEADRQNSVQAVQALFRLLTGTGRADEADAVLAQGLQDTGQAAPLRFLQAGQFEAAGRFEDAITAYEHIYARNSEDTIVANNLASLLSVHRDDAESLERAHAIARRLRQSRLAPFQDTYGWIEYRRGNAADALPYLEAAAEGLPGDPLVQLHLGLTYVALDRTAEGHERLRQALELAGDAPLPQMDEARALLAAAQAGN